MKPKLREIQCLVQVYKRIEIKPGFKHAFSDSIVHGFSTIQHCLLPTKLQLYFINNTFMQKQ